MGIRKLIADKEVAMIKVEDIAELTQGEVMHFGDLYLVKQGLFYVFRYNNTKDAIAQCKTPEATAAVIRLMTM